MPARSIVQIIFQWLEFENHTHEGSFFGATLGLLAGFFVVDGAITSGSETVAFSKCVEKADYICAECLKIKCHKAEFLVRK